MLKPWSTRRRAAALTVGAALIGTLAAACSRALPASFPSSSAASPEAPEASAAPVGVVLAADPPLPGEPNGGWTGLDGAGSAAAPAMEGHQHHHAPAPEGGHEHHHHHAPAGSAPVQAAPDGGAHGHAH
jgi:hypothetical protein